MAEIIGASPSQEIPSSASPLRRALLSFLLVVIVGGALLSGGFFFVTLRRVVAQTELPFVENVTNRDSIPGRAPEKDLPDLVDKKERVNILLLGVDRREHETSPARTDTMILVSIDPATNSLSMLSIPRDLWVTIPVYGQNRINTAHMLGDQYGYPGGGVALAKKTVHNALGVPVHYFVRVDFFGFVRLVDAVGGLTIDVKNPIYDAEYPDGNYGTIVVDIPAGVQPMDGETVLQFARSRHGTGDFDRMDRQQQVIEAARDKAISLDIPLSSIPQFLTIAGDSIQTDLTLEEMIALGEIVKRIRADSWRRAVIDDAYPTTQVTDKGWMVEMADWDRVRQLVDELFPSPVPLAEATPSIERAQIASEAARIHLQNGTVTPDLGERTATYLRDQGFNVVRYSAADGQSYAQSRLIVYSDAEMTVSALAAQLGVTEENIYRQYSDDLDADIVVVLGDDWAREGSY
jgi:LCP family protein required for cell wall assembly